jgi:hypothetical protein
MFFKTDLLLLSGPRIQLSKDCVLQISLRKGLSEAERGQVSIL